MKLKVDLQEVLYEVMRNYDGMLIIEFDPENLDEPWVSSHPYVVGAWEYEKLITDFHEMEWEELEKYGDMYDPVIAFKYLGKAIVTYPIRDNLGELIDLDEASEEEIAKTLKFDLEEDFDLEVYDSLEAQE